MPFISRSQLELFLLLSFGFLQISRAAVPHPHDYPDDPALNAAKDDYTLMNPAPEKHLRAFHPDRPGSTNTPYTVDAGHLLAEFEIINYSHTDLNGVITHQLNYPNPNLRIGVTNSIEVEVAWVPQLSQTQTIAGKSQSSSGIGDVDLRLKKNLFGNDGGPYAWALMPGAKIPTANHGLGNGRFEPYLMIPVEFTLKNGFAISLMPEIDLRKNANDNGMHSEFIWPATFGHTIYKKIDAYAEFVSHSSNDAQAPWINYFGLGLTAALSTSTQLDAGINLGLNSASPQYNPFAGYTFGF